MAKSRRTDSPRVLTPGITSRPETYRAPMHLETQRQAKPRDFSSQLCFGENSTTATPETVQTLSMSGLETLTVGEKRALEAVKMLLYDTNFKGHESGQAGYSKEYNGSFVLPILRVSLTEFFEAYGLDMKPSGRYSQKQRQEALIDLQQLSEKKFNFYYERKKWVGRGESRRPLFDIAKAPNKSLISLTQVWRDLEEEEAEQVRAGDSLQQRLSGLVIECGVPLIDQVDKFYTLKHRNLYKQIQAYYPRGQQPVGISDIVDYLWTLDFSPLRISTEKLAKIADLSYLVEQRKKKQVQAKLQKYLHTIQELGYIDSYSINEFGLYELHLNAEKCSRYKAKLGRGKRLSLASKNGSGDTKGDTL